MKIIPITLTALISFSLPVDLGINIINPLSVQAQAFIYSPLGFRSYTAWYNQLPPEAQRVEDTVKALNNASYEKNGKFLDATPLLVDAFNQKYQVQPNFQPFAAERLRTYTEMQGAFDHGTRVVDDVDGLLRQLEGR